MLPYGTHIANIKNGGSKPPPYDYLFSAYSGFGLLPNGARTATRYACPQTRASGKRKMQLDIFMFLCYNIFENQSETILCLNKHFVEYFLKFDIIKSQKRF